MTIFGRVNLFCSLRSEKKNGNLRLPFFLFQQEFYHFFRSNQEWNFTIFFVPKAHTTTNIAPHRTKRSCTRAHERIRTPKHAHARRHSRFSHNTHTTTLKHTRRASQCLHRNKLKKLSKTKRHSSTPALTKPPFAPRTHSRMQILKFQICFFWNEKNGKILGWKKKNGKIPQSFGKNDW